MYFECTYYANIDGSEGFYGSNCEIEFYSQDENDLFYSDYYECIDKVCGPYTTVYFDEMVNDNS